MKVLYFTNAPFSDLEISYVNELEKLVDVKVLMLILPSTKKSGAISIENQPKELGVIPASEYPSMRKYTKMININRWAIVNNPIGSNLRTSLLLAKDVAKVIKEYKPDIVHITMYGLLQVWLSWQIDKNIKKVITIHDIAPHDNQSIIRYMYDRICRKLTLRIFNNIVLLSHPDDQLIKKHLNPQKQHVFFSKLGPYTYLKNYPLKPNQYGKYILFFGNIRPYKGVDILIKAYKESKCSSYNTKLVIAGKDIEGNILQDENQSNIIIINRYIENDELATLISYCLFVVLPYKSATQSGVTKSAIALDKPIICTNVGNLPNEVIDGRYGKIVKPNDVDALRQGIDYMIDNPLKIKEFGKNIHSDFKTGKNSWKDITEDLVTNIYGKIIND